MKTKELWRWRLRDEITGKTYTTRCVMTEADALDRDSQAVRVEWSKEVLLVPESDNEARHLRASSMLLPKVAPGGGE